MQCSQLCQKISTNISSAVNFVGTKFSQTGNYLMGLASRISEAVAPALDKIKDFFVENKNPVMVFIATIAGIVAIATAIKCCYKGDTAGASTLSNPTSLTT